MSRRRRLVLAPLAAAAVGIGVGGLVMAVVLQVVARTPQDRSDWADLGLIVGGIGLAVVVGVLVWILGLVRAARRLFAPGERLGVLVWSVAAVFVLTVLLTSLGGVVEDGDGLPVWAARVLSLCAAAVVVAAPSVVFHLRGRGAIPGEARHETSAEALRARDHTS